MSVYQMKATYVGNGKPSQQLKTVTRLVDSSISGAS